MYHPVILSISNTLSSVGGPAVQADLRGEGANSANAEQAFSLTQRRYGRWHTQMDSPSAPIVPHERRRLTRHVRVQRSPELAIHPELGRFLRPFEGVLSPAGCRQQILSSQLTRRPGLTSWNPFLGSKVYGTALVVSAFPALVA